MVEVAALVMEVKLKVQFTSASLAVPCYVVNTSAHNGTLAGWTPVPNSTVYYSMYKIANVFPVLGTHS